MTRFSTGFLHFKEVVGRGKVKGMYCQREDKTKEKEKNWRTQDSYKMEKKTTEHAEDCLVNKIQMKIVNVKMRIYQRAGEIGGCL